ncbi:hypothetical protein QFZ82_005936 [Streptomyces sp. V4I23]|uniref:DUF3574 domain-containing protein n=1 Tax=Streptomyces sp. V4I23 TaxID=3042282 RepID=UPI00277F39AF|nr:DUF3574 domain-containing protein [Streptomyces sp. V4I23]MDQ1011451.1 hypothetical protein [Streptomyces sp. V4I23]
MSTPNPSRPHARSVKHRTLLTALGTVIAVLAVAAPTARDGLDGERTVSIASSATTQVQRGERYVETRLFFGTERPDGGPAVTDAQFMSFIDSHVTPGFPDGLTIQEGSGQWRDSNGTIERERSYELTLLYPATEARQRDPLIEAVREAYVKAYAQDAVARLDEPTLADF